jgi:hypothetical protein
VTGSIASGAMGAVFLGSTRGLGRVVKSIAEGTKLTSMVSGREIQYSNVAFTKRNMYSVVLNNNSLSRVTTLVTRPSVLAVTRPSVTRPSVSI